MQPARVRLGLAILTIVPAGLYTKHYTGPAATWVHNYLGGVFYEWFWIWVWMWLRPTSKPATVGFLVLGVTTLLEFLQLVSTPWLQAIRSHWVGQALVGTSFSWLDLPHYVLGTLSGVYLARWLGRAKAIQPASSPSKRSST